MITELIVAALATWQILEIWHHSSMMASWRARIEIYDEGFRGWLAEMTACPFCMSPWTAWFCLVLLTVPHWAVPDGLPAWLAAIIYVPIAIGWVGYLFVWGMAVSRLANLGNDLSHSFCRTVRHNKLELPAGPPPEEAEEPEQDSKTTFEKDTADGGRTEDQPG